MAIAAARTVSQVIAHMAIGFGIAWVMTGSVVLGGLAILIEPLINVSLLPLHESAWKGLRARLQDSRQRMMAIGAEKVSQTGLHMAVAFAVMYGLTGSLAFGGMAAVLEPVCNVILMPFHNRAFHALLSRLQLGPGA
jgi:uncharacterized membrane protein